MNGPFGLLFASVTALLAVACGGVPPAASPSPSPDSDLAVVRIETTGGMLPTWETINWYPTAVLYADGRLITHGPTLGIWPGPAVPNLQVTQLTPQGVAQVLQAALDSGFQGPERDIGEQMLDSGATVFTITTAEGTHVTRLHGDNGAPAVVAAQRFAEALTSARAWFDGAVAGDERPYDWDRLQVVSAPMSPEESPDPALAAIVDWPLASLATLGVPVEPGQPYRCSVVEGVDLETLRPVIQAADQLTLFRSEGETYGVRLRPLLPDEPGCQRPQP